MAINYTRMKHLTKVSDTDLLTELEYNLKMWIDWGLLAGGGWIDVNVPQTGIYGGVESSLKFISDPNYTDGQIWEGNRKDWVWETGVEFDDSDTNAEPINITGVMVSGVSYASGHGTYGWHINYPMGRVVLDNPVATGATVQCAHSYRWAQTYNFDDAPWWHELQYRSHRADDTHFIQSNQLGDWSIGPHHRVQMPSVIIECVPRGTSRGYELGNNALTVEQDIDLNIITESRIDRNKLLTYFRDQKDKAIWLYDTDSVIESGDYPLDYRGMRVGAKMYPDLVNTSANGGHRWKKAYIVDADIFEVESWNPNLFEGKVRWTIEVVKGDI